MNHLPEAQLYRIIFDHDIPTHEDTTHWARCETCRQSADALTTLVQELAIARRSQPSPTQLARYVGLFAQYGSRLQTTKAEFSL
jgi:hypothetical protein